MGNILYILPLFLNSNDRNDDFQLLNVSQERWKLPFYPQLRKQKNIACFSPRKQKWLIIRQLEKKLSQFALCFLKSSYSRESWDFCVPAAIWEKRAWPLGQVCLLKCSHQCRSINIRDILSSIYIIYPFSSSSSLSNFK